MEADYASAFKSGTIPAAYVRLMFLGEGGSGKSSLLSGLMNKKLMVAESTALADTRTVSYQWIKAGGAAEDGWKEHTSSDDAKSLALQSRLLVENKDKGAQEGERHRIVKFFSVMVSYLKWNRDEVQQEYTDEVSKITKAAYKEIIDAAQKHKGCLCQYEKPDVVMHVWDCGGQPIFLDIISAFLTPRTMFLLLFDASVNLESIYKEKWHHNGKEIEGREQFVTSVQLIMQWLQLIHSSLVEKGDIQSQAKSIAMSDASKYERCDSAPPKFPRAMLVGSRRDKITPGAAEAVKKLLESNYGYKTFGDLVVDKVLVDNTKAGKGKEEDAGYQIIRQQINHFAKSIEVPTPLAWVIFRQVLEKVAQDKPIFTFSEVSVIAKECKISDDVIPSVLHFYHQLGVIFHYATIQSLANTIIVKPQWLIDQLKMLLMPEWFGLRPPRLRRFWKWLEERGVLVEELYHELWEDCGLEGGPQALVDLLEHFDLAQEISECPHDVSSSRGRKYFIPSMLKLQPKSDPIKAKALEVAPVREAATLHIDFNMGYVPPGFFIRLVAKMTDRGYKPLLEKEVYRNHITFLCQDIDRIIISELLNSINIKFFRSATRKKDQIHFAESCVLFRHEISCICTKVIRWMPSLKIKLAFPCSCSGKGPDHFVFLKPDSHRESTLFCERDNEYHLSSHQKYWLSPPDKIPLSSYIEEGPLTDAEVEMVSIKIGSDFKNIAEEMEMGYSLQRVKYQKKGIKPAHAMISDFAEEECGMRYELAGFLEATGYFELSRKLLKGEFIKQPSNPQVLKPMSVSVTQLLNETPRLVNGELFTPGSERDKVDIIKEVGARYDLFGFLLLNDYDGSKTDSIEKRLINQSESIYKINKTIFVNWLNGDGKRPVTWATFVKVLKKMGLKMQALYIMSTLQSRHPPLR
jgi:GTPase SAR1 family protein